MRSIWKGTISFGLVSIGVKLYAATEERSVSFHQVRRSDGSRIRYRRVAETDGEEVAYNDIARGYQLPSGETVVLTDADFADLPLPTAKVVDVVQFVDLDQIDPIYFARSYYLEPEQNAVKPYVLLRDALTDSGRVGLVKVAIRNREQLATLRVRDGVIVLETMIWPDEIREPDFAFLGDEIEPRAQERQMARSLVESMTDDFDPSAFTDEYRAALQEVIDAKVAGREVVEPDAQEPGGTDNVVDLMAALRASVDAAKRDRGQSATNGSTNGSATKSRAKKSPTKAAAKKTAPKKSPAKKTAAKKTAAKSAAKKSPGKKAAKKAASGRARKSA